MLREDPKVIEMGATLDMNYRRVVQYFETLRQQADADNAEHRARKPVAADMYASVA